MSDERFCRFATKLTCDGQTMIDGVLSATTVNTLVNHVMELNGLPLLDLSKLFVVDEGFHLHYDICVNGGLIAFEVTALSGPVVSTVPPTEDA